MFRLVNGLDLTEEQRTQIEALKQEVKADRPNKENRDGRKAARKECRIDFIESFAKEGFTPDAMACRKSSEEDRVARFNRRLANLNSVLAILTEEQRGQLADRLENPPARRPRARAL